MNEIKRLQELAGLGEIKVNTPINKKAVFDYFLSNDRLILITNFIDEELKTVLDNSGESLEEYADSAGVDPKMIIDFYQSGLNKECGYVAISSQDENSTFIPQISHFKNLYYQGDGGREVFIVGNNL